MKRILVLTLLAVLLGGMLNIRLLADGQTHQELKVAFGQDIDTFDLHNYRGTQDSIGGSLVYETLVAYDREQKIIPVLATSWKQVDRLTWIFNLKKNVKFHNGNRFNAKAAKFSLERAAAAGPAAAYAGFIESVEILDEYTIKLHLKYEYGSVLNNLSSVIVAMIDPEFTNNNKQKITQIACGTGPFKLEEYIPGTKSVYIKNENYWGTPAKLDRIEFVTIPESGTRVTALKTGEVDLIENPAPHELPALKRNDQFYVYTSPKDRTLFLGFNLKNEEIGSKENVALRKAIAYAIDKKAIVDYVLEGLGLVADTGFIPQTISGNLYDTELIRSYDIDKAKELLKAAGIKSGHEVNIWVTRGRYLLDTETAQVIQGFLEEIGLKANIRVMEYGPMIGALGDFKHEIFQLAWGWMTGEPSQALRQVLHGDSTWNFTGFNNKEFKNLLSQAEVTIDWEERMSLYNQAYKIAFDEVAIIPLLHYQNVYVARKGVKGIYASPREILELNTAYIEKN